MRSFLDNYYFKWKDKLGILFWYIFIEIPKQRILVCCVGRLPAILHDYSKTTLFLENFPKFPPVWRIFRENLKSNFDVISFWKMKWKRRFLKTEKEIHCLGCSKKKWWKQVWNMIGSDKLSAAEQIRVPFSALLITMWT